MKKLLLFLVLLNVLTYLNAQDTNVVPKGYHQHDGFYLSMSGGPIFGTITDNKSGTLNGLYEFSGTGFQIDFKIGGTIAENLILHATLLSSAISGPTMTDMGGGYPSQKANDNISIGEGMIGLGLTYFAMPSDVFISCSLGMGNFSQTDLKNSSYNYTTQKGISLQLKLGKEWWISKNWGMGFSLAYGKTNLTDTYSGGSDAMDSNRFSIMFNTTFN